MCSTVRLTLVSLEHHIIAESGHFHKTPAIALRLWGFWLRRAPTYFGKYNLCHFLWLFLYQAVLLQRVLIFPANLLLPQLSSSLPGSHDLMQQFESYSIQEWGGGGGGGGAQLDLRPERLRDNYWLITVAGMLKKMKITFWPSLLPLSIAALNHLSAGRLADRPASRTCFRLRDIIFGARAAAV